MKFVPGFRSFPSLRQERWGLFLGIALLPLNPILGLIPLVYAFLSPWIRGFRSLRSSAIAKGLGLTSLWFIWVSVAAHDRGESLLGLANFLPYFAVFLAFRQLIRCFTHLDYLARCLSISTLILIILGFGQMYGGWQTPAWVSAVGTNLVAGGRPEGRMSSLLMYANLWAAWLVVVFPLTLALAVQSWRQLRTASPWDLPLWLGLSALEAIALGLTDSRSAWGIGLLIGVAYALYVGWYGLVGGAAIVAGAVGWASFIPWGQDPLRQIIPKAIWGRFSDELYPDRSLATMRDTQWDFCWQMFLDRPVQGWGLRNFTPLYQQAMDVILGHPHSLPLMILSETGLVGFILLFGLVGWTVAQGGRVWWTLGRSTPTQRYQHLWLFAYLVSFAGLFAYNLFDVTLFDLRNNLLNWTCLAAIAGVSDHYGFRLGLGRLSKK